MHPSRHDVVSHGLQALGVVAVAPELRIALSGEQRPNQSLIEFWMNLSKPLIHGIYNVRPTEHERVLSKGQQVVF
jgi:hypothetical protein